MFRTITWIVAVGTICGDFELLAAAERPNVVVIIADDMRPDCLSALGHSVVRTPHLDRLVRGGCTFTRAVAAYPICHASRAELLTRSTAFRTGVPYRGNTIDAALASWAGTFRDAGYHTWYCGKWHNDGRPLARGYTETRGLFSSGGGQNRIPLPDHAGRVATGYVGWTFKTHASDVELEKGVGLTPDTDRHIADAAVELIGLPTVRPFFLHVNFTAPHDPRIAPRGFEQAYNPATIPLPPAFRDRHPFDHGNQDGRDERLLTRPLGERQLRDELAVYYACIANVDHQVGRILDALGQRGLSDRTIVVFSSDQGLALGSHGLLGKQNLYEHTFCVPLVFRGPGIAPGRRTAANAYLRDLFPTTCELAGVPIPATVTAKSLVPILRGGDTQVHEFVVGYFTDTQRAIRAGDWKLIRYLKADRVQLFDLAADPDELIDQSTNPAHAARLQELQHQLDEWLREHGDSNQTPG
jgi:arylsulfatase A-like enzyme